MSISPDRQTANTFAYPYASDDAAAKTHNSPRIWSHVEARAFPKFLSLWEPAGLRPGMIGFLTALHLVIDDMAPDPDEWIEVSDATIFSRLSTRPAGMSVREFKELRARVQDGRGRHRDALLDWQGEPGRPMLLDFKREIDVTPDPHNLPYTDSALQPDATPAQSKPRIKTRLLYKPLYRAPLGQILSRLTRGITDRQMDRIVREVGDDYRRQFEGTAIRARKKREHSPKSDLNRCMTLSRNALEKASHLPESARADVLTLARSLRAQLDRGIALMERGESLSPAADFRREVLAALAETNVQKRANCTLSESVTDWNKEELSVFDAENFDTHTPETAREEGENLCHPPHIQVVTHFSTQTEAPISPPERPTEVCVSNSGARAVGVSVDEFIARTWGDRPIDYRLPISTTDFLSLSELELFDGRAPHGRRERRFCCPLCGGSKPMDAAHRCLSVDTVTGAYYCHRCETKGKLREWFTDAPAIPARSFAPIAPPAAKATPETWRKWLAAAAPIESANETQGADYLMGRGIPTETAAAAGVLFGRWYHDAQPFEGVIFPLRNGAGELSAAQARAITGATKNSRGPIKDSVFVATPGALDAPDIAITEAPIDALALAATGQPAIALCGAEWPDWLIERLRGRRVLVAFDADEAGDKAAAKLMTGLDGIASAERLRPRGAKDWGELAQSYGLAAIDAQFVM